MNKMNRSMTLKSQFIICCLVVAFVPTFVLSIYLYNSRVNEIRTNYIENRVKAIAQINRNVSKQVEWINSLVNQLNNNKSLHEILRRHEDEAKRFDRLYLSVINNIYDSYAYTPIFNYVRSLLIMGDNGLDIRFGADAALLSMDRMMEERWYYEGEKNSLLTWGKIGNNYSHFTSNVIVNSLRWPITDYISGEGIGYGIMLLNQKVFSSCFEELATYTNDHIYIVDSKTGEIIATNQIDNGGVLDLVDSAEGIIKSILNNRHSNDVSYFIQEVEGVSSLITYGSSSSTGWTTVEILPVKEIDIQGRNFIATLLILAISTMIVCIFLSVFISARLTKPLNVLLSYVQDIGKGKFYELKTTSSRNEMDILGNNISRMQSDIVALMEEKVETEQEKRILEIQMLQSQINPHFLYNTLNNIRLMATLQGAAGIVRMTDSLGRILRYSLKKSSDRTILSDEIDIIQDYIHIQNIRYKGKIRFQLKVENQDLKQCIMPRFVLQPIVENAIVHGLCYDENLGKIFISIYQKDEKLYIEVMDNGIGMKEEKVDIIRKYLNSEHGEDKPSDMGLGIYNVHRRIRLMYGKEYGIKLDSKYREYTKVTILLALDLGVDGNEDFGSR